MYWTMHKYHYSINHSFIIIPNTNTIFQNNTYVKPTSLYHEKNKENEFGSYCSTVLHPISMYYSYGLNAPIVYRHRSPLHCHFPPRITHKYFLSHKLRPIFSPNINSINLAWNYPPYNNVSNDTINSPPKPPLTTP